MDLDKSYAIMGWQGLIKPKFRKWVDIPLFNASLRVDFDGS